MSIEEKLEKLRTRGEVTIEASGDLNPIMKAILDEFNVTVNIYTYDDKGGFNYSGPQTYIEIKGTPIVEGIIADILSEELQPQADELFDTVILRDIRENVSYGQIGLNENELGGKRVMPLVMKKIVNTEGLYLRTQMTGNEMLGTTYGAFVVKF